MSLRGHDYPDQRLRDSWVFLIIFLKTHAFVKQMRNNTAEESPGNTRRYHLTVLKYPMGTHWTGVYWWCLCVQGTLQDGVNKKLRSKESAFHREMDSKPVNKNTCCVFYLKHFSWRKSHSTLELAQHYKPSQFLKEQEFRFFTFQNHQAYLYFLLTKTK